MRDVRLRLALAFVAVALLLGVLTVIFWDFARDTIITPIYYAVWIGSLVVRSIPEGAFLALLLVICAGIGLNALANSLTGNTRQRQHISTASAETRYHHWERLCANLYFSRFSRHMFASEARRLVLALLAFEYRLDIPEVEALLREDRIELSETIRNLVLGSEDLLVEQPLSRIDTLLRRLRRDPPNDPQIDALLNEIIAFVENHLEIVHVGNPPESRN